MIRSMTGFGKASRSLNGMKVSFEVRTLNSKQLDLSTKIPSLLSEFESSMRPLIIEQLIRGKVFVQCNIERTTGFDHKAINHELALAYHKELKALANQTGEPEESLLSIVMRMPDVTKPAEESIPEDQLDAVLETLADALEKCNEFRHKEGEALAVDIRERVTAISTLLADIEPFEAPRLEKIRQRIQDEFRRNFKEEDIDRSRFEQELVYYIEKLDINEEKVRLAGHCRHFLEVLDNDGTAGKKLNFISQEMGREINTIGSKANDLAIQKLVVSMKDELEKIKEQTLNIL